MGKEGSSLSAGIRIIIHGSSQFCLGTLRGGRLNEFLLKHSGVARVVGARRGTVEFTDHAGVVCIPATG